MDKNPRLGALFLPCNRETNEVNSRQINKQTMRNALFTLILFSSTLVFGQGINFETTSWQSLLDQAKASNKLIMVDCYTTWCGPCKKMDAEVFTDQKVGKFYNKSFINAKFDMEKGEGLDIAKQYEIRNYPSIIFVDGEGTLVHKGVGFRPSEKFLALGERAANPRTSLFLLEDMYKNSGGRMPAADLLALLNARMDAHGDINEVVTSYVASGDIKDWGSEKGMQFIMDFVNSPSNDVFKEFIDRKEAFVKKFGQEKVDGKVARAFFTATREAAMKNDPNLIQNAIQLLYQDNPDFMMEKEVEGMMNFARFTRNEGMYKEFSHQYGHLLMEKPSITNSQANTLNGLAWDVYEDEQSEHDPEGLKQALKMIDKALEMDMNYAFADTKAALLLKSGNKAEGKVWVQKALDLAKKENVDGSETKKLLEKWL